MSRMIAQIIGAAQIGAVVTRAHGVAACNSREEKNCIRAAFVDRAAKRDRGDFAVAFGDLSVRPDCR